MKNWRFVFLGLIALSTNIPAQHSHMPKGTLGATSGQTEQKNEIVAVVNGEVIKCADLDDFLAPQLKALELKQFEFRRAGLESLLEKKLFKQEAAKRGLSETALWNHLTSGVAVAEEDVEATFNSKAAQLGVPNSEVEAKERIRASLLLDKKLVVFRRFMMGLRASSLTEIHLKEPDPLRLSVQYTGPQQGPSDALVTIVEFSDFQCSFCRQASATVRRVLEVFNGQVRVILKHLPGRAHPNAFDAAKASYCAEKQGKFWEYHDVLFKNSRDLSERALLGYAEFLALDTSQFKSCFSSEEAKSSIERDVAEGSRLGVVVTPSFFVNGQLLKGSVSPDVLEKVIRAELKRLQGGQ